MSAARRWRTQQLDQVWLRLQSGDRERAVAGDRYGAAEIGDPRAARHVRPVPRRLAAACAVYATLGTSTYDFAWFKSFFTAFAALAPLPSFFFANHYSRLAAMMRWRMGFGACGPRDSGLDIPHLYFRGCDHGARRIGDGSGYGCGGRLRVQQCRAP